jgi:hypothetical protein
MGSVGLIGIGKPRSRLTEKGNAFAGGLGLDGIDDSLIECFE